MNLINISEVQTDLVLVRKRADAKDKDSHKYHMLTLKSFEPQGVLERLALIQQSKEYQEIQKLPKTLFWSGLEIPCIIDLDNDLISYGQKKKRKLQRKLDRSLRATNPDNYNKNGTVKKGKKFKKSNRYKTISQDLAETDRVLAAYRKSLHGKDINEILAMGTRIQTEKVSLTKL